MYDATVTTDGHCGNKFKCCGTFAKGGTSSRPSNTRPARLIDLGGCTVATYVNERFSRRCSLGI